MSNENHPIPQPRFTGIFIPAEILELENITILETMLLSWIDALYCSKHGGCFASNEYLAKKLRVKENTIAKALTNLRQLGYIQDVSFDGRIRVIKAKISKIVDDSQSKADLDLNPTPIGLKSNPVMDKNPTPSYIESKVERKDINTQPDGCSAAKAAGDCVVSFGSHVKLKAKEYESLKEQLGKARLDDLIQNINDHCAANGKRYKDYAAAVRNFARNQDSRLKNYASQGFKNETVKEFARQRQLEEYKRTNGGFDDNVLRFTD